MRKKFSTFAIVGGGPSGFYTAKKLFQINKNFKIDIFEKLPVPFGLIRYGVAPDHQKIKNCQNELSTVHQNANFNFYGNVSIGKDLSIQDLEKQYSAIIFAYGAQKDLQLNIKNEYNFENIYPSNSIVNWYNAHPDYLDFKMNVENVKNAVIIGNGNVSLDIIRVFAKDKNELQKTDIYDKAFQIIKQNKIENITIIGRRGIVQSAFTLKEIRELQKSNLFEFYLLKQDLKDSLNSQSILEITDMGATFGQLIEKWGIDKKLIINNEQSIYLQQSLKTRANLRKIEFMNKNFNIIQNPDQIQKIMQQKSDKVKIFFRYLLDTDELIGSNNKLESILFKKSILHGDAFSQSTKKSDQIEKIDCDLLIKSIGFKSEKIDNLVLKNNILQNSNGCLIDQNNEQNVIIGKYTVGWLKTGPKGIIDQTFMSSEETVNNIRIHSENNLLQEKKTDESIEDILKQKRVDYVTFYDWLKIDQYEKNEGEKQNKVRVKTLYMDQMKKIINSV